jgi:DNA processing protein
MTAITDKEKLARLRLIRTENIGPITYYRLLQRFGTAEKALSFLPEMARRGGKAEPFTAFPAAEAEREMATAEKFGAQMIFHGTPQYPPLLSEIEDAPPVITVMGDISLLPKPALGVVGARNASLTGRKIAEVFSGRVADAGFVIVSGLARGIDTAAHMASLKKGTVAVVAGGIDVIYPRENETLYRDIAAAGCIVAESPFATEPLARHFPRRNRIISGLSHGVLVVEAADKSGSLITARMALEQNREVFAVPGSPMDPRASGTNSLLKDGAHMAASADDILQVLHSLRLRSLRESPAPWQGQPPAPPDHTPDEKLYLNILEMLSPTPVTIDELIRALNVPAADVMIVILEMEIAGRIERQAGNRVNLI